MLLMIVELLISRVWIKQEGRMALHRGSHRAGGRLMLLVVHVHHTLVMVHVVAMVTTTSMLMHVLHLVLRTMMTILVLVHVMASVPVITPFIITIPIVTSLVSLLRIRKFDYQRAGAAFRNSVVHFMNSQHRSISIHKLHESTSLRMSLRTTNDVNFFQLTKSCKHIMQDDLSNGLRKHTNKNFVFTLRLTLSRSNLQRIHSIGQFDNIVKCFDGTDSRLLASVS
mmetsp:Transcript_13475/g.22114  ORF Transcript_13475/g.22114 Transcript_13475/m.22114 type:complete len:225 (+) Transcript_13475:1810-2484(+)